MVKAVNSVTNTETTEASEPIEISVPLPVMSHSGDPIVVTSRTISIPFTYNFALKYYIVETYDASGFVSSTRVNTPSSPVVVEDLTPETTYDVIAFPYNFVDINGTALLGINITTLPEVPGPVILLTKSTGNGGSKTFSWSAPVSGGAATSYEYKLNNLDWISNGSSTSVSLTGLFGTNTFQVRGVNSAGNGTAVSTGSFVVPTINSGPTAILITSSSATISWSPSNWSSYRLTISGDDTVYTGTSGNSVEVTGLNPSTTYTPTLVLTSSTNDTATTVGSSFTTLAPSPSPPTITSSSSTTTSITLNFTLGANSTSTRAYINGSFDGNTTGTSYTFFGLSPGTSYTLALYGYNGTVQSSTSSGGSYTTQTGPALIPTFGSNTSIGGGFSGSVTNYNSNYTWEISTSAGFVAWDTPSGSTRAFVVYGLSSGQSATVTVTTSRPGYNNGSAQTTGSASTVFYTVTWNANGGSVSPSSNTVSAGSYVIAPFPTRTGYTFNYWRNPLSGDLLVLLPGGEDYTPTANITFYAIWTQNVSIPSGGSVSLSGGSTPGSVITASTSGWSGSPTSYDVFITTALSPYTPTSSSSRVASSGGGSSTSYTITPSDAISPVNIFRAFATASNSAGTSSIVQSTNIITATSGAIAPSTPTGLTNTYSSGPTWTGTWSASSGTAPITYYWTLYQSLTNGGAVTATASGSTTGTSFTQSMNSSTGFWAYFTVYASNSAGNSGTATSGWA